MYTVTRSTYLHGSGHVSFNTRFTGLPCTCVRARYMRDANRDLQARFKIVSARTQDIASWATTIGCCYSGVLKLSFISQATHVLHSPFNSSQISSVRKRVLFYYWQPARVYRGVREEDMELPPQFMECREGKFAGGVEVRAMRLLTVCHILNVVRPDPRSLTQRAFMSTTKSEAVALDYSGGDCI